MSPQPIGPQPIGQVGGDAITAIFGRSKAIIGVVHLLPLPGSPRFDGEAVEAIYARGLDDARAYLANGCDGVIVENHGDVPFAKPDDIGPETAAHMSVVADRIRRELGDKDAAVQPPATAVPRQTLLEIQKSQADLYEVNQADYQRERSFLKRGTDQLVAQTQVLTRLQSEEEQGVSADKAELDRLTELLNRGAVVSQRVTDARRNVLLSSTRNLQVTAQLMLATKQKDEFARQIERTDDLRRVKLLTELSDRVAKAEQLKARGRALKERMVLLSAQPEEAPGWRRVPTVSLVRRVPGTGRVRIPASEDTELCPGDVVEATLRSQADVAANP